MMKVGIMEAVDEWICKSWQNTPEAEAAVGNMAFGPVLPTLVLRFLLELDPLNSPHTTITMAPLGEQLVDQLKSTVDKLEARVAELEARLHGKAQQVASSSSSSTSDEMRIILMGPPGAGMRESVYVFCCVPRLTMTRQRYPGSQDQGKVQRLPFGASEQTCRYKGRQQQLTRRAGYR
jgi:hypothetical protein